MIKAELRSWTSELPAFRPYLSKAYFEARRADEWTVGDHTHEQVPKVSSYWWQRTTQICVNIRASVKGVWIHLSYARERYIFIMDFSGSLGGVGSLYSSIVVTGFVHLFHSLRQSSASWRLTFIEMTPENIWRNFVDSYSKTFRSTHAVLHYHPWKWVYCELYYVQY